MFRNTLLAAALALTVAAACPANDNDPVDCPGGQCPAQPAQLRGKLFDRFQQPVKPRHTQETTLDPKLAVVSVMIPNVASGVIVHVEDGKALIVTAQHCISDGDFDGRVRIRYASGDVVTGYVVQVQHTGDDLAAIVAPADENTVAIGVATAEPQIGAKLIQCGYTHAEPGKGPFQRYGILEKTDSPFMYLSIEVDRGDSGSGVFNAEKQLVGICVRKQSARGPGKAMAYEFARLRRFFDKVKGEVFPRKHVQPQQQPKSQVVPPPVPMTQEAKPTAPVVPPLPEPRPMTREEMRAAIGADDMDKRIEQIMTLVQLLLGGGAAGGAVPIIMFLFRLYRSYKQMKGGSAVSQPVAVAKLVRRRRRRKVKETSA